MKTALLSVDLNLQQTDLHKQQMTKFFLNLNANNIKITTIENKKIKHLDMILSCDKNNDTFNFLIENKTDSYVKRSNNNWILATNNLVIELISYIPAEVFESSNIKNNAISKKINPENSLELNIFIEKARKGVFQCNLGYGLSNSIKENNIMSYMYCPTNESLCIKHIVLKGKKINNFVKNNYFNYDKIITKTKNAAKAWYTISLLCPLKEFDNI